MTSPIRTRDEFGPRFDAALDARHAGDLEAAKQLCLQALDDTAPDLRRFRAILYGELGYIYGEQGDDKQSAECYRRSVALAPRAELPSLGLFHALAQQHQWLEAMEEAVRFLRGTSSDGYRALFCDGFGDDFDPPIRALVQEARALLQQHLSVS
jgi:hypothetical protein